MLEDHRDGSMVEELDGAMHVAFLALELDFTRTEIDVEWGRRGSE
jgi:hypothetical protein